MTVSRAHISLPVTLVVLALGAPASAQSLPATTTPIEHLIVVVGENLSFDNLFGTYQPKSAAAVHNLLSAGIVNTGRSSPKRRSAARKCAIPTR
jgi:phospholipase C